MELPDEDDFARWDLDPVTRFLKALFKNMADQAKEDWLSVSWESAKLDPATRAELRTKYEIYNQLSNAQREYYENEFKYSEANKD
jgi:hypothetical protein